MRTRTRPEAYTLDSIDLGRLRKPKRRELNARPLQATYTQATRVQSPGGEESERAIERMAAMELELAALQSDVRTLSDELELARRQHKSNHEGGRAISLKENKLMEQVNQP